jgi:hypothetical protein
MHDPEITRSKNFHWSIPKNNRGLLNRQAKNDLPGPHTYAIEDAVIKHKKPLLFKMPREERKFDASKYAMMHNELIVKGFL